MILDTEMQTLTGEQVSELGGPIGVFRNFFSKIIDKNSTKLNDGRTWIVKAENQRPVRVVLENHEVRWTFTVLVHYWLARFEEAEKGEVVAYDQGPGVEIRDALDQNGNPTRAMNWHNKEFLLSNDGWVCQS